MLDIQVALRHLEVGYGGGSATAATATAATAASRGSKSVLTDFTSNAPLPPQKNKNYDCTGSGESGSVGWMIQYVLACSSTSTPRLLKYCKEQSKASIWRKNFGKLTAESAALLAAYVAHAFQQIGNIDVAIEMYAKTREMSSWCFSTCCQKNKNKSKVSCAWEEKELTRYMSLGQRERYLKAAYTRSLRPHTLVVSVCLMVLVLVGRKQTSPKHAVVLVNCTES